MADDTRLFHDNNDPDESDLADVPRVFTHSKCGRDTQLSAACVRRYERDPFRLLGAGSLVWCSACGKNARSSDCRWVETGESVHAYYRRLIGRAYLDSPTSWIGRFFLLYGVLGSVGLGVALLAYYHKGGGRRNGQDSRHRRRGSAGGRPAGRGVGKVANLSAMRGGVSGISGLIVHGGSPAIRSVVKFRSV